MCRKAAGDAMAKLHTKQQAGSDDAFAGLSVGLKSDDTPTWTDRVLGTSCHVLLGTSQLPKDFLLDLPT